MAARETTVNIKAHESEKALWREHAPGGNISKWVRRLIAAEIERTGKP